MNLNHSGMYDRTPLVWAAGEGHGGVAKSLLECGNVDHNSRDQNDEGPLGGAATSGCQCVFKLLLQQEDVDPNHADRKE